MKLLASGRAVTKEEFREFLNQWPGKCESDVYMGIWCVYDHAFSDYPIASAHRDENYRIHAELPSIPEDLQQVRDLLEPYRQKLKARAAQPAKP